jgi:DUF4097 and DUF4098 domain-containing protein YvlB
MKTLAASLVLAAALPLAAAELSETIDRTIDVKSGAVVQLSNVNGRVRVSAWDQPRVRIVARKEVRGDRDVVSDALRELRVDIQARNGGVIVQTHYPKRNDAASFFDWILGENVNAEVEYDVTVPRAMSLELETVNGGIRVDGVDGRHRFETTNGKIEVSRCAGSIEASTTNGGIAAELLQVAKGQRLEFETTNGRIQVTVPRDLAVDVDAGTTNGSIESELPVATTRVSRNSLRGSINGGGTPLRLRTTNGGIEIRSTPRG